MNERFVVEVTEPVEPAELEQVAQQVGECLKQPPERFAALLEDRIGPVTHPLARAPAEQVADVLRSAGVHVMVGEAPPVVTLSSTRWLPSPHDSYERELQGAGTEAGATGAEEAGAVPSKTEGAVPSVREGWIIDDPPERPVSRRDPWVGDDFEATGPRLRRPLLGALLLALAVLIALQVGLALWGGQRGGYDVGLAAYRQGRFAAAREFWLPAAEGGDARAQFMVGYLSEMGMGQPWSNAGAAPWYRQAAERGYAQAQARLASLYARGMGVQHDEVVASRWYLAAAQQGLLEAQHELGLRFLYQYSAIMM